MIKKKSFQENHGITHSKQCLCSKHFTKENELRTQINKMNIITKNTKEVLSPQNPPDLSR